jgi:two-component system sensor histidine kinase BarA
MTHYHGNNSFRSEFSDAEILHKVCEITSPLQQVGDRQTQDDRLWSAIPDIVWKANADGWATYLCQRWEEYTGVAATAALGFGYLARVHPEDRARLLAPWRTSEFSPESYEVLFRLQTREGTYRWNLARGAPANPDSHEVLEWVGTYIDMDTIKQTQTSPQAEPEFWRPQARSEANFRAENLCEARTVMHAGRDLQAIERFINVLSQRAGNLCELLQAIADATVEAIAGAEFCLVALPESDSSGLKLTAVGGAENFAAGKTPHVQNKLLWKAFATGEPLLLRSESGGPLPAAACAAAIESRESGRLGVLAIGNGKDSTAIDAETQQLLAVMGKQAAIAINTARAIEKLKKQEQLLELQNELLIRQQEELENQGRRIQQQKLQLLEAAKLKSQFLDTMSHELLTPMNGIIGFSQLLLRQHKQVLSSNQTEMVGRILRNGKNLLVLIKDILDLSKIENGRTQLETEEFDLGHLVMDVALEFGNQATDKNVAMFVSVCLQNQLIVNDKLRLRQVLVNLISNAVKFTHRGSISIEARELLNCDRLIITVRDTGIGICPTEQHHIFDKFHQADQSITRQYPGTGLGLAISASLVKMMNGTITVESQPKKGSTFRIELPRKINPEKQHC